MRRFWHGNLHWKPNMICRPERGFVFIIHYSRKIELILLLLGLFYSSCSNDLHMSFLNHPNTPSPADSSSPNKVIKSPTSSFNSAPCPSDVLRLFSSVILTSTSSSVSMGYTACRVRSCADDNSAESSSIVSSSGLVDVVAGDRSNMDETVLPKSFNIATGSF